MKPIDADQILNETQKPKENAAEEAQDNAVSEAPDVPEVEDGKSASQVEIKDDAQKQETTNNAETEVINDFKEPEKTETVADSEQIAEEIVEGDKNASDENASDVVEEKEEIENIVEEIVETVEEGAALTEPVEEQPQTEKNADETHEICDSVPDGRTRKRKSKSKKSKSRKSKSKRKSTRRKKKQVDSVDIEQNSGPVQAEAEQVPEPSQPAQEVPISEEIKEETNAPELKTDLEEQKNAQEIEKTEPVEDKIVEKKDKSKSTIKKLKKLILKISKSTNNFFRQAKTTKIGQKAEKKQL